MKGGCLFPRWVAQNCIKTFRCAPYYFTLMRYAVHPPLTVHRRLFTHCVQPLLMRRLFSNITNTCPNPRAKFINKAHPVASPPPRHFFVRTNEYSSHHLQVVCWHIPPSNLHLGRPATLTLLLLLLSWKACPGPTRTADARASAARWACVSFARAPPPRRDEECRSLPAPAPPPCRAQCPRPCPTDSSGLGAVAREHPPLPTPKPHSPFVSRIGSL